MIIEFLPIIECLIKTYDFLTWFVEVDGFVNTLLYCTMLKNNIITNKCLEFLSVICEDETGHKQVLDAYNDFLVFSKEKVRFQSTITLLSTTNDSEIVLTILVFFNSLIEKTNSIAQRLAVFFAFLV